jgi:HEAT repeat protein
MTASHSAAFQRFLASFEAPGRAFLDQLDTAALLALVEPERSEAEDRLLQALATDDPRIARALVDLGSTRAIEPLRQTLARTQRGQMRVAAARALFALTRDASAITAIIDVLRSGDRSSREAAASVLRVLPVAEVQPALFAALGDRDASVRGLATSALYALHHLDDIARDYRDPLGVMRMWIVSPLPSVAVLAAEEIRTAVEALARGATVSSLALDHAVDDASPAVHRLMASHANEDGLWAEHLDVAAIPASGAERAWAECMLVAWLPRDFRASLALAELQSKRAVPALLDLVQVAHGRLAIEAAVALARIAGDESGLPHVIEDSASGADRLRAVEALRYFAGATAEAALRDRQADADPRIAAMAAASLLHRAAG